MSRYYKTAVFDPKTLYVMEKDDGRCFIMYHRTMLPIEHTFSSNSLPLRVAAGEFIEIPPEELDAHIEWHEKMCQIYQI